MWAAAAKQNSEYMYTRSGLMVGVAVQRGLTCSDAGREAQVKSVKWRCCNAHQSCMRYENDDYQMAGVTPAVADRTGHCNRKQDNQRQ